MIGLRGCNRGVHCEGCINKSIDGELALIVNTLDSGCATGVTPHLK